MVSKHCTDNDPINKNLRLEKKFQIFLALHAALQNKQTKKSGYLERQHCNPSGAVPSLSVPTKPTHPAKIGWKDDFVILIWILLKSESRLFTFVPSMCHSQGPWNKCGSPQSLHVKVVKIFGPSLLYVWSEQKCSQLANSKHYTSTYPQSLQAKKPAYKKMYLTYYFLIYPPPKIKLQIFRETKVFLSLLCNRTK